MARRPLAKHSVARNWSDGVRYAGKSSKCMKRSEVRAAAAAAAQARERERATERGMRGRGGGGQVHGGCGGGISAKNTAGGVLQKCHQFRIFSSSCLNIFSIRGFYANNSNAFAVARGLPWTAG